MRTVHLVSDNQQVIGAIKAGLDPDDRLITYDRARNADRVTGASHALLDLGVTDGHDIGYHTLRGWLFRFSPKVAISVLSNAAIPAILPPDLRGDRIALLPKTHGPAELARRWREALMPAI